MSWIEKELLVSRPVMSPGDGGGGTVGGASVSKGESGSTESGSVSGKTEGGTDSTRTVAAQSDLGGGKWNRDVVMPTGACKDD